MNKLCVLSKMNSNIEIINARRIIVEEMIKIIDYSENKIILDIGNKILTICGFELGIYDYCNKNIVIDGMITSVMFE